MTADDELLRLAPADNFRDVTRAEASSGSLDGYLRDGLGLDDEALAAVRARLRG